MTAPRPDLTAMAELQDWLRKSPLTDCEHCSGRGMIQNKCTGGSAGFCSFCHGSGKMLNLQTAKWAAAIDALLAERAAHEWRPIETAPKNQKVLVFYRNSLGKGRRVLACYHTQLPWSDNHEPEPGDGEYAPEGWYEESETHEEIHFTDCPPTYWLPLPTAPQPKGPDDE